MDHIKTEPAAGASHQLHHFDIVIATSPMAADISTGKCSTKTDTEFYPGEKMKLKQHIRRYRKSRPRRKRKGKSQRNQDLVTSQLHPGKDENGNSWCYNIGAPRNDNEFLLNQSKWQLDPKSGTFVYNNSCPTPPHESLYPTYTTSPFQFSGSDSPADPLQQDSDPEAAFPYATSDDENETCPICHRMELRKDSGVDSDGDTSGYTSCSPHIQRHVCLPTTFPHTSGDSCHNQREGPDPSFLERNFEAEYEDNLTRELQNYTKEELVLKCKLLLERAKELESQNEGKST